MKIEIHVLQNFAPSCLNRDDTNTPKSCTFGGVSRARISSQSWKHAVRENFRDTQTATVGERTRRLFAILEQRMGWDFNPERAKALLNELYSKSKGDPSKADKRAAKTGRSGEKQPTPAGSSEASEPRLDMDPPATEPPLDKALAKDTAVLLFVSQQEIEVLEKCIRENITGKDAETLAKQATTSADIALFGRMMAERPGKNIDAACQVAHAISTHATEYETDFYTAVDDYTQKLDEVGAGMMGTQGFNSACFYRYALIDMAQLTRNLGHDPLLAVAAAEAFLRSFVLTVPSAKQNSHAAQNLPSFGLFVARDTGTPLSLANAFAHPVRGGDLIDGSIRALTAYQAQVNHVYGLYKDATMACFHDRPDVDRPERLLHTLHSANAGSLDAAIEQIIQRVRE